MMMMLMIIMIMIRDSMMRSRYSIFGIWLIPSSYRIESNEIKFKSSLFFLFCSGFISLVLSFFLFLFFDFFCFVTQRTGSHHTTYIFLLNSLFLSYIHIHIHTHTYYIILYYIILYYRNSCTTN